MVDSVHDEQEKGSPSADNEIGRQEISLVPAVVTIVTCVTTFGVFIGYIGDHLSRVEKSICGGVTALLALFMGAVVMETLRRSREQRLRAISQHKATAIHNAAVAALRHQAEAYERMLRTATEIVSERIASRMVREMMPNLSNDEQREAAFERADEIVTDEIKVVLDAVAEHTAPVNEKLKCPPGNSED